MCSLRLLLIVGSLFCSVVPCLGQTVSLTEIPRKDDCFKFEISTLLSGNIKINQDGKTNLIPLNAKNHHVFVERTIELKSGAVRKTARHYEIVRCVAKVNNTVEERGLRDTRRLIATQRLDDGSQVCFCPAAPITRPELEGVALHFDSTQLTGLLPEKDVAIGDSWKVGPLTIQAMCLYDGLINHEVSGKLTEVKDGIVWIAIEGKASGIELGAMINSTITAKVKVDPLTKRIIGVEWKQKDTRDQGPASPACEIETETVLTRKKIDEEPKELASSALVSIPKDEIPPLMLQLQYREAKNRYHMLYSRDWHIVGQLDRHVVMRLIERGDFIAQATITPWKKVEPGKHLTGDEFKKVVAEMPGWEIEEIIDSGEVPTEKDRHIYRVTAKGTMDELKVVQSFFILANEQGEQIIVTITMKPSNASKIGTRDMSLVNSIIFGVPK